MQRAESSFDWGPISRVFPRPGTERVKASLGWVGGSNVTSAQALPTPRSGYSEYNHQGEKPGLALPAASSQLFTNP